MSYRLTYDATIDDAADVSWRLVNRTHAFRKQLRTNVIAAGAAGGLAFFVAWTYVVGRSPLHWVLAAVAGTVFGIVFASIFRRFLETEIRKQQRKIVAEQFGWKPTIQSAIELRPDAVWVRQAGMEMVFPWTLCTGVQNNPHDIEMNFVPGICVIRNRHFASPAERQAFLDNARRLSSLTNPTTPTNPTSPS
jgi:phosphate/sulfate permease